MSLTHPSRRPANRFRLPLPLSPCRSREPLMVGSAPALGPFRVHY